ncbi:DUF1850 domain-containing protein [Geosporobacter ferrireducens]|uniref:DUF1850 domain-containing protein n=2 Tax=Geosporobacter ferrireducens TaxID=1424294 RepID=A0A1D8GNW6_9FIRM|nr:DUF1850 domain-containing protein [Geosporobacter ferrireducens]AOT72583.1 hypothetical protein Gferi_25330 [Geosporobacter ferrireducens]
MKTKISFYLFAAFLIIMFLPVYVLEVIDGQENRVLYQTITKPLDQFSIQWIHSVSKQPVTETYQIHEDLHIGILEMIFNENGPNLPAGPEGGTKWEIKDGYFRVYNYDLVFDRVPVRIGQVIANHTLIYKQKELPLKDISRPGGLVYIQIRKATIIKMIIGGIGLWRKATFM